MFPGVFSLADSVWFQDIPFCNEYRPHRAIARRTPAFAYEQIPKAATIAPDYPDTWQVRYDTVDQHGSITLRYAGRLRHLGVGRGNTGAEVICLVHGYDATVITHDGDVLAEFVIDPGKDYQRKNT